jgi:nucleotidyltransferase substrate binding protein (TIGR01987 family)
MNNRDIYWRQRLHNFNKAMVHLQCALDIPAPDMVQKAGIIQLFEMNAELAWKLIKDFLEAEGFNDVKTPRSAIKTAFEVQIITDGYIWLELLDSRNLTSHTYDEARATEMEVLIANTYFPLLQNLLDSFNSR